MNAIRMPFLTLTFAGLMAALWWLLGDAPDALMYDVNQTEQGWRWLTAHFVHVDGSHLLWNLLPLLLLGGYLEQRSRRLLITALATGVISVNIYLATGYDRALYAGLSGVLNSLQVFALWKLADNAHFRTPALFFLALTVAKNVFELVVTESLFTQLAWASVPQAHIAGLTGALLYVLAITRSNFSLKH